MSPTSTASRAVSALMMSLALLVAVASSPRAQDQGGAGAANEATTDQLRIWPILTDSPRDTLGTFLRLRDDLETALGSYRANRSQDGADLIELIMDQFAALIDLDAVPPASREEVGRVTAVYLLDIVGRVMMPDLDSVPDVDEVSNKEGPISWRIPKTPIRIVQIDEGPRQGEFLFSSQTIHAAPRFFRGIEHLPLDSAIGIQSWSRTLPQGTGPMIPTAVLAAMPDGLKATWLDTPIWKVLIVLVIVVLMGLLVGLLHWFLSHREFDGRFKSLCSRMLQPFAVILLVLVMTPFIDNQLVVFGDFSNMVDFTSTLLIYMAFSWIFWQAVQLLFELIILSPRIPEEGLDANLLRLLGGLIGVVGVILILAYGGQELGLPVFSLLAGLGIGGLAVALAIRPTLENLIGGVILYLDKPVRVGDFCNFGDHTGTVEAIGIRSTQIRALDRTQITIPNAQFADMQIVNWAKCDQMLINETIGLRYETSPDQLRFLLTKLREMLHAHPRIESDTIRVRFSGYGDSALNVTLRIYARTREWNDFHAIREDIFMRIYDLVTEAGTGFAFPSRTVYLGRDSGLEEERGKAAVEQVERWRRAGRLPFPRLSPERITQIEDTLDYPPRGSTEAGGEIQVDPETLEGLSAEPLSATDGPADGEENPTEPAKR